MEFPPEIHLDQGSTDCCLRLWWRQSTGSRVGWEAQPDHGWGRGSHGYGIYKMWVS